METETKCVGGCDRILMHARPWRALPLERREQMRETHARYAVRTLCQACYRRTWRAGTLVDHDRRNRPLVDVAEDWQDLAPARRGLSQNAAVQQLAPRMGMSPSGLEKAILRAKRLGLLERAA